MNGREREMRFLIILINQDERLFEILGIDLRK